MSIEYIDHYESDDIIASIKKDGVYVGYIEYFDDNKSYLLYLDSIFVKECKTRKEVYNIVNKHFGLYKRYVIVSKANGNKFKIDKSNPDEISFDATKDHLNKIKLSGGAIYETDDGIDYSLVLSPKTTFNFNYPKMFNKSQII